MLVSFCLCVFLAGFMAGNHVGERRWKQAALDALDVAARAIEKLRGNQPRR